MSELYFNGANERILNRVPVATKRILDLGCAAGRLGGILKQLTPDREVWGIEAVATIAAEAKKRLDHVIVGDVEEMDPLPLPNERYFDCLICGDVLEHLRDPQKVLERLRNHLAPGATVIVNVPNIAHWSVVLGLLQGNFAYADSGLLDRTHLRFFTPGSLKEMLWEAGYLVTDENALEVELANAAPLAEVKKAFGRAAQMLGIDSRIVERTASIYQQLYVAKPVPDPYSEPDKMEILLGPHIGKLCPATKRTSVIVLTYNSMSTIESCLNSVLPTLDSEDELILVDNASTDDTPEYLTELSRRFGVDHGSSIPERRPKIRVILNDSNTGFSRGCNTGILESRGEYLILLNPDTEVWPGWIEGLIAPFADEKVGAVGPLSNSVCGDQFVGLHVPFDEEVSCDQLADMVHSRVTGHNQLQTLNTKLLIGMCLALRRKTLNQIGLLEESCFLGADDLEISWRMRTLGHDLRISTGVFVMHIAQRSFSTLRPGEKEKFVELSDNALVKKLKGFYSEDKLPTSMSLWNSPIFDSAFSRA